MSSSSKRSGGWWTSFLNYLKANTFGISIERIENYNKSGFDQDIIDHEIISDINDIENSTEIYIDFKNTFNYISDINIEYINNLCSSISQEEPQIEDYSLLNDFVFLATCLVTLACAKRWIW